MEFRGLFIPQKVQNRRDDMMMTKICLSLESSIIQPDKHSFNHAYSGFLKLTTQTLMLIQGTINSSFRRNVNL